MKILVLGAGALGGYYGGRLVQTGSDVTFLVREGRRDILNRNGLNIESPAFGNFSTRDVQTLTVAELPDAPRFDMILLTCKAFDLADAIETVAPAADAGATVLPMLNGLAHMDVLNARFGQRNVLGGLAKIAATLAPDGTIRHLNDWSYITFGEQDGSIGPRVTALKEAFDKTCITAAAVPDIQRHMWEKFVHLGTVASMTCAMRASVGEIARTRFGSDLLKQTFEEMAALAAKNGVVIDDDFRKEYYALFENKETPYTASMLRDLEQGRVTEGEHIVGYAVDRAAEHGLETPNLRFAYTHLMAYDERRRAGRL